MWDVIAAGGSDQFHIRSVARAKRLHSAALNSGGPRSPNQSATAEGLSYASVGAGDEEVHVEGVQGVRGVAGVQGATFKTLWANTSR